MSAPQNSQPHETARLAICLPDIPVLAVNSACAVIMTTDGEIKTLPHAQAQMIIHKKPVLVCHRPYTRQRLGMDDLYGFDLLELFAFVHPARFCVPTPAGLARTLGVAAPGDIEDYPPTMIECAQALLSDLQNEPRRPKKVDPLEIAKVMGIQGKGWAWTPFICATLGTPYNPQESVISKPALNVWKNLPEWSETAPEPPPSHYPVTPAESHARLSAMLSAGDKPVEPRPQQSDYAAHICKAFAPKDEEDHPHIVLAEAGTGTGKTLGYLAPASVWAEKNDGSVWISTYTKNLQRQIDDELDRLYPHPDVKKANVTIRKGRENYLCLLNFEDMAAGAALAKHPDQVIAAGLMARWIERSADGDLQGGDFPGWLPGLLGWKYTRNLSDTRGECIYAACDHYHKCFVERNIRRARHASIVVANHALVMIKAAIANPDDPLPQRFVFDEGHHLFDAADSAFAGHLTARETHDLRRWIKGVEGGRKSRARGLKRRLEDLVAGDAEAEQMLEAVLHESACLTATGWSRRLKDKAPQGATEIFLALIYQQVMARAQDHDTPYSIETATHPPLPALTEAAQNLRDRLRALQKPLRALVKNLRDKLASKATTLDTDTRRRIISVTAALERRAEHTLAGWIAMLGILETGGDTPSEFVDWMAIERIEGRAVDVGMYRHWIDPMQPFAKSIMPYAHGIAITSATLRDAAGHDHADTQQDWQIARVRSGTPYMSAAPHEMTLDSPFDYAARTKIIVINDVQKHDMDQVAASYRALFMAAGGGALGLFTAIQRLRAVHDRIAVPLEQEGLPLYAQHIDNIDTGTLVDMFREDTHACLLGTDAVRDGVDVPGESLRLLVYDRVPWPRPTILHKARRQAFGGRNYDEMLARLKLRQAYGRLIRSARDKGVFVMLDSMLPTRLCSAFPENVTVQRIGLHDALAEITRFFLAPPRE